MVGKSVQYIVDYHVPMIGREFGRVRINGQDVATKLVGDGWLKTRQSGQQSRGKCVAELGNRCNDTAS